MWTLGILSYVPRRWKDKNSFFFFFFLSGTGFLHPPNPPKSLGPAKGLTFPSLQQRVKSGGRPSRWRPLFNKYLLTPLAGGKPFAARCLPWVTLGTLQEACSAGGQELDTYYQGKYKVQTHRALRKTERIYQTPHFTRKPTRVPRNRICVELPNKLTLACPAGRS